MLDLLKALPVIVPPDNVVSITNGLICNVVLETESESSVEPDALDELSELVLLNESLVLPHEIKMRLKKNMRIIYMNFFILFPNFLNFP